jgi:Phytanoyl-CoA dioxygenase (PhyH)
MESFEGISEEQRYLFDLQGYVTIPDALDPSVVEELDGITDRMWTEDVDDHETTHRFGGLLARDEAFLRIIDNRSVLPLLEALLGADFRLDHDYLDVIRSGLGPIGARLHGGSRPFRPGEYYWSSDGNLHSGLLVVAYNLRAVEPGDGGFACVPGSHKSGFRFPDAWKDLDDPHPTVRPLTGPAGSAIIFTEALVHGTMPWQGQGERRTLFYKYSPHALAWSRHFYNADDYEGLTERQRTMLRVPGVSPVVYGLTP